MTPAPPPFLRFKREPGRLAGTVAAEAARDALALGLPAPPLGGRAGVAGVHLEALGRLLDARGRAGTNVRSTSPEFRRDVQEYARSAQRTCIPKAS